MTAERSSHIIFNSYPQRHQIKLVFFVDLHHFICKCLILPGGVFMAEMIVKCLSCNLKSLAVKTDPSCDPTVISLLGIELNFSSFLTCRDMDFIPYLRHFFSFNVFYNPVLYRNFSERVKDRQRTTLWSYSCYFLLRRTSTK